MSYGTWAVVCDEDQREDVLLVPTVTEGRNMPLHKGSVDEFVRHWKQRVVVSWDGTFIDVRMP